MAKPWDNLPRLPGETALQLCERAISMMAQWHRDHAAEMTAIDTEARRIALTGDDEGAKAYYTAALHALYAASQEARVAA